jgi:K+-sensing histidine kinase KdpD
VHVLATTPDGTRAGLTAGLVFARRWHTGIVLLVTSPDKWETARCVRVAREFNRSMPIRICQGPNVTEAIKQVVPTRALVVMGGPARRWWPTVEQRLADRLRRHGRDVVFVQEKAPDRTQRSDGLTGRLETSQLPRRASVHPLRCRRSDGR